MQTLDQFVTAHNGKLIDFDGVYGAQCVDPIKFYCRDVLGIPPIVGNAIDEFGKESDHITWVRNDPHNLAQLPPRGAIIIWGANIKVGTGTLGHTAIVLKATAYTFDSFDQNWPVGAACHTVHHTYDGIIGWGVAKVVPVPAPLPVPTPAPKPAPTPAPDPTTTYGDLFITQRMFNFVALPPDDTHPPMQVTTFVDALAQAHDYLRTHPDAETIMVEAIITRSA